MFQEPDVVPAERIVVGAEGTFFRWSVLAEPQYYVGEVGLRLRVVIEGRVFYDDVRLGVAPYVVLPHTQDALKLYALQDVENVEFRQTLAESGILETYTDGDQWAQDVVEIGYTGIPGSRMHVYLRLPGHMRTDPISGIPEDRSGWVLEHSVWHEEPNLGEYRLRNDIPDAWDLIEGSGNYGGNLEIIPPWPARPAGRVVVGNTMGIRLRRFINDQEIQGPVVPVNTRWLAVGHVDEMLNFRVNPLSPVVDPNTGRRWSIVAAGPMDALHIIEPPNIHAFASFFAEPGHLHGVVEEAFPNGLRTVEALPSDLEPDWLVRIYQDAGPATTLPPAAGQIARVVSFDHATHAITVTHVENTGVQIAFLMGAPGLSAYLWEMTDYIPPVLADGWHAPPSPGDRVVFVRTSQEWQHGVPAFFTVRETLEGNLPTGPAAWHIPLQGQAQNRIDGAIAAIEGAVGQPVPLTEVPVLFNGVLSGDPDDPGSIIERSAAAWSPGLANFQLTTPPDRVWAARPHGPQNWPGTFFILDLFERTSRDRVGAGVIRFPENWNLYHRLAGEVHCGTNVRRRVYDPDWWELLP